MWMILAMGLADLGGYCIPALPKGQNWQMVETKFSNKMRPIVWTNRRQIRVSFPLGSVGDDWNLSHDSSGVPRSPLAASQSSCHWTIPWQIQNRENVENLWILENDIKSTKSQIQKFKMGFLSPAFKSVKYLWGTMNGIFMIILVSSQFWSRTRDATRNPEDPVPRGPGQFFTPWFPKE